MSLDLSGVQAKIDRAYEHLETLDAEIESWTRRYPYGLRGEESDDGRDHIGFLEIYRVPDHPRLALLSGECVHSLRTALDYLIRAVAQDTLAASDLSAVEGKLAFPICTDPKNWTQAIERKRLEGVGPAARASIERKQPYHAPDPARDELAILQLLDDWDKHRLLHTFSAVVNREEIEFAVDPPLTAPPNKVIVFDGPYEDGAQIYHATFSEPGTKLDMKCALFLQIGIRESPLAEEIRETLVKLGQLSQRIVSDVAKAHLKDIAAGQS